MNREQFCALHRRWPHFLRFAVSWMVCVFALALAATSLKGADDSTRPTSFYIVSEVTSDASPFWSRYVLDVRSDGQGSKVRWIRIGPMDSLCPRAITVKALTSVLPHASPAQLSEGFNVCSVDPERLERDMKTKARVAIDDSIRFSVVAHCGDKEVVFHLPYKEALTSDVREKVAQWWEFERTVRERALGPTPTFTTESFEVAEEMEREGEALVPELRAGIFDKALAPDCVSGGPCIHRSLGDDLNGYVGPVLGPVPQLSEHYKFDYYVAPDYPPLALRAHLSGPVTLNLVVDTKTGQVQEAKVVTGHPIFQAAAIDAARRWKFAPSQIQGGGEILATLVFNFSCPEPLRTSPRAAP